MNILGIVAFLLLQILLYLSAVCCSQDIAITTQDSLSAITATEMPADDQVTRKPSIDNQATANNDELDEDQSDCDFIVRKCQKQCDCSPTNEKLSTSIANQNCIKSWIKCLEHDIGKCCSYKDLCPAQEREHYESHVGDILNNDEQLFDILTETDDIRGRWKVQYALKTIHTHFGGELAYRKIENETVELSYDKSKPIKNCTVAFINRYLSMTKCRQYCQALGAKHFRWFHDGCCECVSQYCLGYGIHEPKCDFDMEYY